MQLRANAKVYGTRSCSYCLWKGWFEGFQRVSQRFRIFLIRKSFYTHNSSGGVVVVVVGVVAAVVVGLVAIVVIVINLQMYALKQSPPSPPPPLYLVASLVRIGWICVDVSLFLSQLGYCVVYFIFVADNMGPLLRRTFSPNPPWLLGTVVLTLAQVTIPLTTAKRLRDIALYHSL